MQAAVNYEPRECLIIQGELAGLDTGKGEKPSNSQTCCLDVAQFPSISSVESSAPTLYRARARAGVPHGGEIDATSPARPPGAVIKANVKVHCDESAILELEVHWQKGYRLSGGGGKRDCS